jgi:hypothetical protein
MWTQTAFIVAVLVPFPIISFNQIPEDQKRKFDEAERRIVRLAPTAFPELPGNVVQELQRRGCTIPQESYTKGRNNVIKGRFAKPGAKRIGLFYVRSKVFLPFSFFGTVPNGMSLKLPRWKTVFSFRATLATGSIFPEVFALSGRLTSCGTITPMVDRSRRRLTIKELMMRF